MTLHGVPKSRERKLTTKMGGSVNNVAVLLPQYITVTVITTM